jgi:uncharacterized protein HemX
MTAVVTLLLAVAVGALLAGAYSFHQIRQRETAAELRGLATRHVIEASAGMVP